MNFLPYLDVQKSSCKICRIIMRHSVCHCAVKDRLCGLVVRVPGIKSRGIGFDSRRYQIFWEVMGLERGQLSLVSTIKELLGRNNSGSGLENREYGRGNPLCWPRDILYPKKLALTSPTSGGRSVCRVRLRTKTTEFFFLCIVLRSSFTECCTRKCLLS
jgi:hypothetical protein